MVVTLDTERPDTSHVYVYVYVSFPGLAASTCGVRRSVPAEGVRSSYVVATYRF